MTEMPSASPKPTSRSPNAETPAGQRKISLLLGIGIVLLPIIFAWFLLRRGHSTLSRVLGFGWLVVAAIIGFSSNSGDTPRSVSTAGSAEPGAAVPVGAPARVRTPEEIAEEERSSAERLAEDARRQVRRSPENFLEIERISGSKEGFETILEISGRVRNTSEFPIKDPVFSCELTGPSGTRINEIRETLYQEIPAKSMKSFNDLSMGFMGSQQVENFSCTIVDAVAVLP